MEIEYGSIVEPNEKVKMAIESIRYGDMLNVLEDAGNFLNYNINVAEVPAGGNAVELSFRNTQLATAIGNTDEKELYSIRCRNINSTCCWDSRPSVYGGTPLIYNGSLNFQNTNPEKSFCIDVDGDIANSGFMLIIHDNYVEYMLVLSMLIFLLSNKG